MIKNNSQNAKLSHGLNRIKSFMTEDPIVGTKTTLVSEGITLMEKKRIRHLPIASRGKIVGIVSERSLKQARALGESGRKLTLEDVMTPEPYCVSLKTPLVEVIEHMIKKKIGSAIVQDEKGKLVGIFTATDGLEVLANFLEHHEFERRHPDMEQFFAGNIFV